MDYSFEIFKIIDKFYKRKNKPFSINKDRLGFFWNKYVFVIKGDYGEVIKYCLEVNKLTERCDIFIIDNYDFNIFIPSSYDDDKALYEMLKSFERNMKLNHIKNNI